MRKLNFSIVQDDDGYPPVGVESVWVRPVSDKLYEIDNIPFFTCDATLGDIVLGSEDEDGNLWFQEVVRPSTHSLIRVVFFDHSCEDAVIENLRKFGCGTECMKEYSIVSVDVPGNVDLKIVQNFLGDESLSGVIDYEEALLRHY